MPQNNVLPVWRADYPLLAPAQKPGGVTVSTTATAPRVPNKFTYAAGTIQSFETFLAEVAAYDEAREHEAESQVEEEPANEEEEYDEDDGNGGTVRRTRTVTRSRTTTRRR